MHCSVDKEFDGDSDTDFDKKFAAEACCDMSLVLLVLDRIPDEDCAYCDKCLVLSDLDRLPDEDCSARYNYYN